MTRKEVNLDFERSQRTGLSEAVLCSGKTPEQLESICERLMAENQRMLFTRMTKRQHRRLAKRFPELLTYDPVSRTAYNGDVSDPQPCRVAVVTGGSSDVPVAREAMQTLAFYGFDALPVFDVGVAGLWRISERLQELRQMRIIICVAGMDAALPTVLGGLVPGLLIAVPSSVGYGRADKGNTALNALLSSCAPGITVVNIDNGYGAACAALRILHQEPD